MSDTTMLTVNEVSERPTPTQEQLCNIHYQILESLKCAFAHVGTTDRDTHAAKNSLQWYLKEKFGYKFLESMQGLGSYSASSILCFSREEFLILIHFLQGSVDRPANNNKLFGIEKVIEETGCKALFVIRGWQWTEQNLIHGPNLNQIESNNLPDLHLIWQFQSQTMESKFQYGENQIERILKPVEKPIEIFKDDLFDKIQRCVMHVANSYDNGFHESFYREQIALRMKEHFSRDPSNGAKWCLQEELFLPLKMTQETTGVEFFMPDVIKPDILFFQSDTPEAQVKSDTWRKNRQKHTYSKSSLGVCKSWLPLNRMVPTDNNSATLDTLMLAENRDDYPIQDNELPLPPDLRILDECIFELKVNCPPTIHQLKQVGEYLVERGATKGILTNMCHDQVYFTPMKVTQKPNSKTMILEYQKQPTCIPIDRWCTPVTLVKMASTASVKAPLFTCAKCEITQVFKSRVQKQEALAQMQNRTENLAADITYGVIHPPIEQETEGRTNTSVITAKTLPIIRDASSDVIRHLLTLAEIAAAFEEESMPEDIVARLKLDQLVHFHFAAPKEMEKMVLAVCCNDFETLLRMITRRQNQPTFNFDPEQIAEFAVKQMNAAHTKQKSLEEAYADVRANLFQHFRLENHTEKMRRKFKPVQQIVRQPPPNPQAVIEAVQEHKKPKTFTEKQILLALRKCETLDELFEELKISELSRNKAFVANHQFTTKLEFFLDIPAFQPVISIFLANYSKIIFPKFIPTDSMNFLVALFRLREIVAATDMNKQVLIQFIKEVSGDAKDKALMSKYADVKKQARARERDTDYRTHRAQQKLQKLREYEQITLNTDEQPMMQLMLNSNNEEANVMTNLTLVGQAMRPRLEQPRMQLMLDSNNEEANVMTDLTLVGQAMRPINKQTLYRPYPYPLKKNNFKRSRKS